MVKLYALWTKEPPADRYSAHVSLARKVPGAELRHGKIFGTAEGEPDCAYVAEMSFPDRESFDRAMASSEMQAAGADADTFGIPIRFYFAEVR